MCWPHSLAFLSYVFICLFPWEESQRPTLSGFPSALKLCSEASSTVFATEPVSSKKTFERDVHFNRVSVHLYLPDSNCHTHVSKRQPFSSPEGWFLVLGQPFLSSWGCTFAPTLPSDHVGCCFQTILYKTLHPPKGGDICTYS